MKMKTYNSMTDFLNSLDNSKITGEIQAAFVKAWNKIHGYGGNSEMELSTMYPEIMVSVSGGSDSDIVLDLVERIGYPLSEVHYAFLTPVLNLPLQNATWSIWNRSMELRLNAIELKFRFPLALKNMGFPF